MAQVITLGEILADFVPETGKSGHCGHNLKYILRPGGAPANVAVNLSRLGVKTAVLGRIGSDFIGDYLEDFLRQNRVVTSMISRDSRARTGLVFVFKEKYKGTDFAFYGEPSADKFLSASDVRCGEIKNARLLHFGSISMMAPESSLATEKAVSLAQKYGLMVSFDPNVRLNLWQGRLSKAREEIRKCFAHAGIIKLSAWELKFLFGVAPSRAALGRLFGSKAVFVTESEKGCYAYCSGNIVRVPAYKARVVDTTGAGDAFMAGVIYGIIRSGKKKLYSVKGLLEIARFANKMGALAVSRKGAV
ncbi:MAG TPA: carbohydrate kinase [Candidatus Goldiibacteriota bacterium]|nr:carbohydrate kinase [Candidatus Goldiibacteriota bacterium]